MKRSHFRIGAGLLCLVIAGCGDKAPDSGNAVTAAVAGQPGEPEDGRVDCAIGKGAAWSRTCLVERSEGADGSILTLRHPDGGFRRFRIVTDGRGLIPADGAEKATVSVVADKRIEVTVGEDRYRLPATIGSAKH